MPKNKLSLKPLIVQFKQERQKLPRILGNKAVKFFQSNFDKEGFQDRTVSKWKERNYKPKGGAKKQMQVTGRLRRSIKTISANWGSIKIGTKGVAYARIHNEGLKGKAFGKYAFQMPKRQFIGESYKLQKGIKARIEKELRNLEKRIK
jgi:phage gpG-like protein